MINKIGPSLEAAVADIRDGSTILIGGFGGAGMPSALMSALIFKEPFYWTTGLGILLVVAGVVLITTRVA